MKGLVDILGDDKGIRPLLDKIEQICDANGWDFYCVLAKGVNDLDQRIILGDNNFLPRSTIESHTSLELFRKILPSNLSPCESIDSGVSSR